jgi:hypothetical protein
MKQSQFCHNVTLPIQIDQLEAKSLYSAKELQNSLDLILATYESYLVNLSMAARGEMSEPVAYFAYRALDGALRSAKELVNILELQSHQIQ